MKGTNTDLKPSNSGVMKMFVDIQKAIDGLALIVEQDMALSAFEAGIFVFFNKGRDKIKVLYWERPELVHKMLFKIHAFMQHTKYPDFFLFPAKKKHVRTY